MKEDIINERKEQLARLRSYYETIEEIVRRKKLEKQEDEHGEK